MLLLIFLAQLFGGAVTVYPHPVPSTSLVFIGGFAAPNPYLTPPPSRHQQQETALETIEATTGHRFALGMHYYGMHNLTVGNVLTDPAVIGDLNYGRMPWFSQTCNDTLQNISAGLDDKFFIQTAQALQALQVPVGYRFFHEFNLCLNQGGSCANGDNPNCFPAGGTDTTDGPIFIAAWEHIHNIFVAQGVTNVAFVWCPNVNSANLTNNNLNDYLPPLTYVDWLGGDVYDKAYIGFSALISPWYTAFSGQGKPMILNETGENNCAYNPAGCSPAAQWNQLQYMDDIATNVPSTYPLLHGIVFFSSWPTGNTLYDWILDSGGLSGLTTLQGESPFNARGY